MIVPVLNKNESLIPKKEASKCDDVDDDLVGELDTLKNDMNLLIKGCKVTKFSTECIEETEAYEMRSYLVKSSIQSEPEQNEVDSDEE